jgi:hypothetical protein
VATGDIKWRFGGSQYAPKKTIQLPVVLKALSSTPANRDVRVMDIDVSGDKLACAVVLWWLYWAC